MGAGQRCTPDNIYAVPSIHRTLYASVVINFPGAPGFWGLKWRRHYTTLHCLLLASTSIAPVTVAVVAATGRLRVFAYLLLWILRIQINTIFCRNKRPERLIFRNNKKMSKTHQNPSVFVYSPLWKITYQTPSVLCTPPFEKSFIETHRFCVLPPLKNHPSKPIGFV